MIKLNLDSLMKEKNINITDISRDTGIARSTLTPIVNNPNDVKSVRFDTLDKLCGYLDVDLSDLLIYTPNKTGIELIKMYISKNREFGVFEIKRTSSFSEKSAFVSYGSETFDDKHLFNVSLEIMDEYELEILNNKVEGFELKHSLEAMEQKEFKRIIQNLSRGELFDITTQIAFAFINSKQYKYITSTIELYWAVGSFFLDREKNTFTFNYDKDKKGLYDNSSYNEIANVYTSNNNVGNLESGDFKVYFGE